MGTPVPGRIQVPAVGAHAGKRSSHPAAELRRANVQPSSYGAQRRLRALMARSWSPEVIERTTGIPAAMLREAVEDRASISSGLAEAVATVYDRLWDRDPPRGTTEDRAAAERAEAEAESRGWAPPMAWDDDQLDLPTGKPAPGWKPGARATWRAVDLVSDAEFIREQGGYRDATMGELAARLGVPRNSLIRAYSRARAYGARGAAQHRAPEAEAG